MFRRFFQKKRDEIERFSKVNPDGYIHTDIGGYLGNNYQGELSGWALDIRERQEARSRKDFSYSDSFRKSVAFEVQDIPTGTLWFY